MTTRMNFFLFSTDNVQIVSQSWDSDSVVFCTVSRYASLDRMFLKMVVKWLWPWCLLAVAFAEGEFPGTQRDPSVLRLLNKYPSNGHKARTQWSHYAHEDNSYRQASEGISHGYAVHPQGQALKNAEVHSEYPVYSASSLPEHRSPSSTNLTFASGNAYSYSRPYLASTGSSNGPFHKDTSRGTYHYLQIRPGSASQTSLKKILPHYHIPQFQLRNADGYPKTNFKKTVLYSSPSIPASYKKLSHPKVHKPYAKHKYPIHKTAHPLYRKYYQSPYQRYAIPFTDPLHHKLASQTDYAHYKNSGSSTPSADGYHTTERMDDTYPDGSAPADDYSHYNDTHYNAGTNYHDAYEDPHKPPPSSLDPYPVAYHETTTRGYYGDRIYMSTHLPLQTPLQKLTTGTPYFILRRTDDDDDDDDDRTIFD